jgi:hypothetical protein
VNLVDRKGGERGNNLGIASNKNIGSGKDVVIKKFVSSEKGE